MSEYDLVKNEELSPGGIATIRIFLTYALKLSKHVILQKIKTVLLLRCRSYLLNSILVV